MFSPSPNSFMNFFTSVMHLLGSSATAYYTARTIRDPLTRPNLLAGFQLAESGSVPFLEKLAERATSEGDSWLAEKLARHAADEQRHGQIFAQALKQHGKQVIDFKRSEKPNKRRRSPFFEAFYEGYNQDDLKPERIDWLVFMGSTYILELDASKDFVRMANALSNDEPRSRRIKQGILSIAQDETRHASYLHEALHRRLSTGEAQTVIDEWRTRKVNALLAMVGGLLQQGDRSSSLVEDAPAQNEKPELATA